MKTKICKTCQQEKAIDQFALETSSKNGRKYRRLHCIPCRAESQRVFYYGSPERLQYRRRKALLARFNLTIEQYDEMATAQDNKCAICKQECSTGKMLAVDHDHACCPVDRTKRTNKTCGKCTRGLLCTRCNIGLGYLRTLNLLSSAINYLGVTDANSKEV